MVAGDIVMRVCDGLPVVAGVLQDRTRSTAPRALSDITTISVAQVGLARAARRGHRRVAETSGGAALLILVELTGPFVAESAQGGRRRGTPHHIAERYGLLIIIALGEGIIVTLFLAKRSSGRRDRAGRWMSARRRGGRGRADVRPWWVYFVVPWARSCTRAASVRSAGARGTSRSSARSSRTAEGCTSRPTTWRGSRCSTSVGDVAEGGLPVAVYFIAIFIVYAYLTRTADPFHLG